MTIDAALRTVTDSVTAEITSIGIDAGVHKMTKFPGRIDMVSNGDAGFRVKVYLDQDRIEILSREGEQWTWPLDELTVQRDGASRFHLNLGEESVFFTPDEPLAFAQHTLGQAKDGSSRRGFLRDQIEKARQTAPAEPAVGEVEWIEDPEPRARKGKRRASRHEHEWTEGTSSGVLRRRCVSCGHVSIDITGFVSEFDLGGSEYQPIAPTDDDPTDQTPLVLTTNL